MILFKINDTVFYINSNSAEKAPFDLNGVLARFLTDQKNRFNQSEKSVPIGINSCQHLVFKALQGPEVLQKLETCENLALRMLKHFRVKLSVSNTAISTPRGYFPAQTNMDMDNKVFNDVVHGLMEFHPLLVIVADTPQMQRLRNIRQLGACSFVFPSAVHSRFEHSIGTAFIAGKLFDSLKEKRIPSDIVDDAMWEKKKLCAQIAGLCHDIGHGPFSHTWEAFRKRFGDKWTHEEESVKIFDEVLKERISPTKKFSGDRPQLVKDAFTYYGLNESDIKEIKEIVSGKKEGDYLYQVINNKVNGIDVDKWEYLARDSVMLNVPIGFDFKRILKYCCILKNYRNGGREEICFREKECPVLLDMFLARGKLHDVAYQHTKVKIIELMIIDAFTLAEKRLALRKTPTTQLTDHIFYKILYDDFGNDEDMNKAKEILRRIERRHLYKCIARESFEGKCPELQQIKKYFAQTMELRDFAEKLTMTTITVHMTKWNRKTPLKGVLAYQKQEDQSPTCKPFNWNSYQDCLKPEVENLKRYQVLLLYTGENEFPSHLMPLATDTLKQVIVETVS